MWDKRRLAIVYWIEKAETLQNSDDKVETSNSVEKVKLYQIMVAMVKQIGQAHSKLVSRTIGVKVEIIRKVDQSQSKHRSSRFISKFLLPLPRFNCTKNINS